MRVAFYASNKPREQELAAAFLAGAEAHGDSGSLRDSGDKAGDCDVAVMVGVKSCDLYRASRAAGRHRQPGAKVWEYWRIAVDAHHPTGKLMAVKRPHDRMYGVNLLPWRRPAKRGHIVIAGSSAKYHRFYNLPDPTAWAIRQVHEIRKHSQRQIIYRPKPSWHDAVPIPYTTYSDKHEAIGAVLKGAHALVTHGSNACFEAITRGVPCIILGDGVAKPISSTDIAEIEQPRLASIHERRRWLASLAYYQWTVLEFQSGEAWASIRPQIG
jgi:hypothetical protein